MANCVELASSLGEAIPGVNEYVATAPVAPVLPQAPHVSQFGVSSTLSSTVTPVVLGVGDGVGAGVGVGEGLGVGVGEALGVGVGEGLVAGAGTGVGVGELAAIGALLATVLPPQPMIVCNEKTSSTKTKRVRQLLRKRISSRGFGLEEVACRAL
jgi:hypothetical protein